MANKGNQEKSTTPWYMAWAQWIIGITGALEAYFHAFPIHEAGSQVPVTDSTGIAWLGTIAFAVLLPRIHEFKFAGFSAKVNDAIESADDYKDVLKDATSLLEQWSESANTFVADIENEDRDEERLSLFQNFLRDRMGEAKTYLGNEPGEDIRIALWVTTQT